MLLSKRQDIDYKYFEYKLRNDYPTYEGMKMEGNNIYLSFSDDETAYSSAINTFHDGLINTDTIDKKYAKIYRYMTDDPPHCKLEAPIDHNYITDLTIRLHPKRTMVKGEVQKVEWFSDEATTDLILKVDINYTRDPLGFALDRTTIRTWINEDETENTNTKITKKLYTINLNDQIKEGIRRRSNIVDELKITVLNMMMNTILPASGLDQPAVVIMGRDFMKKYQTDFNAFVDESNTDILADIQNDTEELWLDNTIASGLTIRDFIIAEMTLS